jgi:PilZ domain
VDLIMTAVARVTPVFAMDRRSNSRKDVTIWSRVRVKGQPDHPARVVNISRSGCMIMSPCVAPDYAIIMIELPQMGWVSATSLWTAGDRIGLEFDQLLAETSFARLRPYHV